jgi:serine/threonine protein kinase/TolB-like protein
MTREEWHRVKSIAGDALGLPERDRPAFVAERCASDEALRREVESLVAATCAAADRFEVPATVTSDAAAALAEWEWSPVAAVGRRIGPYRIIRELGRGGMGIAYLAERADHAYARRVAVKLIKRGMDTDAIVERFIHERQILADLSHPNIAMLLDGGTTDDGLPYFVMEYVEGSPIDAFCGERRLPVEERLHLVRKVCEAAHHAHEHRVVHRDLKPGNILVTRDGVPKLLDFGIAKVVDVGSGPQARDRTLLLRAMTPQYASPEQVRDEPISPASDVYSLGVLLYQLLTGRCPYDLGGRTLLDAERLVCEEVPPVPSRAIDIEAGRVGGHTATALRRRLAGDLDAIVMTALEKSPARRYPSAKALADDLGRHLDGLPVAARRGRLSAIASRLRRARGRPFLTVAALLVGALYLGMLATRTRSATPEAPSTGSVAVMPMALEGDTAGGLDYVADGLVEGLINRLSAAPSLRVIARDSVYRYKGRAVDPQAVGRDLNVATIVTGRLQQQGAELAVSLALVDTRTQRNLWGALYRRPLADVQRLSADLSRDVASNLRVPLSRGTREVARQEDRQSPEAYELYLKGRYFWNRRTTTDLRKGIACFRLALEKDPTFVMAHVGLADSLGLLTEYHGSPAAETYPGAARAAARALELDETSAEAHASVAYVRQFYEWDLEAAETEFRRAIELNPNYTIARQWYAEFLSAMGRHDEALLEIRHAASLDPLSLIVKAVEANILYMARRYDEAIAQSMTAIDMDPNFPESYEYLKRSLDQRHRYAEAVAARQTRRRLLRLDVTETSALRAAAAATRPRKYWRMRLEQELIEGKEEGLQPFEMSEIHAQAGDAARSLDWLEKACHEQHDFMTMYMRVAPNLDPIRAEARYQALLASTCRLP